MVNPKTEPEVELMARKLKREEAAKKALNTRSFRPVQLLASFFAVLAVSLLSQTWRSLPSDAGFAVAALTAVVPFLAFEVYLVKRQLKAVIYLAGISSESDA